LPRSVTESPTEVGIARKAPESPGERRRIARRHDQTLNLIAHKVTATRNIRDDERAGASRRFQHCPGEALAA
jgi:hypothetical protein